MKYLPFLLSGLILFPNSQSPEILRVREPMAYQALGVEESLETRAGEATVTAYTARTEETDAGPTITASGQRVREGIVACPRKYPFGTKFLIDGKIYDCQDRMAKKHDGKFDIYFEDYDEAINFGIKTLSVKNLN